MNTRIVVMSVGHVVISTASGLVLMMEGPMLMVCTDEPTPDLNIPPAIPAYMPELEYDVPLLDRHVDYPLPIDQVALGEQHDGRLNGPLARGPPGGTT